MSHLPPDISSAARLPEGLSTGSSSPSGERPNGAVLDGLMVMLPLPGQTRTAALAYSMDAVEAAVNARGEEIAGDVLLTTANELLRSLEEFAASAGIPYDGSGRDSDVTLAWTHAVTHEPGNDGPGEILGLDARFARHLESIGELGTALAARVRASARGRWRDRSREADLWRLWRSLDEATPRATRLVGGADDAMPSSPPRAAVVLAEAIWAKRLEQPPEQKTIDPRPAAIGEQSFAYAFAPTLGRRKPSYALIEGSPAIVVGDRIVATIVDQVTPAMRERAARGAAHLGTTLWHRLLFAALSEPSRRRAQGEADPGLLAYESIDEFTRVIGVTSHKDRTRLEDLLALGQVFSFSRGPKLDATPAWRFDVTRPAPGRASRLVWRIMPWVYGRDVEDRSLPRGASPWLLFISDSPPPIVATAGPRTVPAQWAFWWAFLVWLRVNRREELGRLGQVTITEDDWRAIARSAGWTEAATTDLLPAVVDCYVQPGAGNWLMPTGRACTYRLGPCLASVGDALARQQRRESRKRAGGLAAAAARRNADTRRVSPRNR